MGRPVGIDPNGTFKESQSRCTRSSPVDKNNRIGEEDREDRHPKHVRSNDGFLIFDRRSS